MSTSPWLPTTDSESSRVRPPSYLPQIQWNVIHISMLLRNVGIAWRWTLGHRPQQRSWRKNETWKPTAKHNANTKCFPCARCDLMQKLSSPDRSKKIVPGRLSQLLQKANLVDDRGRIWTWAVLPAVSSSCLVWKQLPRQWSGLNFVLKDTRTSGGKCICRSNLKKWLY